MEKFIVVRVCKGGGGGISPALSKKEALNQYNNWSDAGNTPHNLFVKVFDTDENEYRVMSTWTFSNGIGRITEQHLEKILNEEGY